METLTIKINNPKAKRLIDDLADLGLISVNEVKPSWNDRWLQFSESLPDTDEISEEEINQELSTVRKNRESNL